VYIYSTRWIPETVLYFRSMLLVLVLFTTPFYWDHGITFNDGIKVLCGVSLLFYCFGWNILLWVNNLFDFFYIALTYNYCFTIFFYVHYYFILILFIFLNKTVHLFLFYAFKYISIQNIFNLMNKYNQNSIHVGFKQIFLNILYLVWKRMFTNFKFIFKKNIWCYFIERCKILCSIA